MWGRRPVTHVQAREKDEAGGAVGGRPRALSAIDELLRRADWERLAAAERDALLAVYKPLDVPADPATTVAPGRASDRPTQDWVASLLAPRFQPEATSVMQCWLADASPDAHLFVGGRVGHGRTCLVASLARQAMAQRPTPPDYCYVPHPTTLDRAYLLSVPRGMGKAFVKALGQALGQVCQNWQEAAKGQSEDDQNAPPSAADHPQRQLLARTLDPVVALTPESARDYLHQLRTALDALVGTTDPPPLCPDDVPVVHVLTGSDDADADLAGGESGRGAPVLVTSLAQTELQGALLRANGGVLILPASDFIERDQPSVAWSSLASMLRTRTLILKQGWPPIPLTTRVVLVGTFTSYQPLYWASDDFARLFRYEAWFQQVTDWTREAEATYAALADGVARRYSLPQFEATGVARLAEEGARRVGGLNRTHLSADLLLLHDLALEAGQMGRARGAASTTGADVEAALQRRRVHYGVNSRRYREALLAGQEIVPTTGTAVGQVNGLSVFPFHPTEGTFAAPFRVSATVSPGRAERLVDIEREARTTDSSYIRGALTMAGYLARRYGAGRPVSVVARIRFEQEHSNIGGDSASAAELFAVLSALAQVPVRATLAITGAVGQYGEIQPIGGVNEKIEGFWEVCRARRAQGEPAEGACGVIIPASNAADLMLRPDVAESIAREGWFHVWPIRTVDEGLALLTGRAADDVHRLVDQRLQVFQELAQGARLVR